MTTTRIITCFECQGESDKRDNPCSQCSSTGEVVVIVPGNERVCKGSWSLNTACGTCQRCRDTLPRPPFVIIMFQTGAAADLYAQRLTAEGLNIATCLQGAEKDE